jgi:fructokinase
LPAAALVHFGSLGAALSPGSASVERLVRDSADAAITFDPNIRTRLEPDLAAAKHRVEQHVRWSTMVKASQEDIAALYRHSRLEHVARRWLSLGPSLVVVTRGEYGSYAVTKRGAVACPAPRTDVVDTIGAGDAVMSTLIAQLVRLGDDRETITAGIEALSPDAVEEMLGLAAAAAAITVAREGAEPPTRGELPQAALG